jgi:phosphopantothenoylcysteine decarboxylase/phosphopantothenate--cysteine ligase
MVAPAMDLDMYQHPTTQNNIKILKEFGNIIIEAATGELASGLSGKGRMEEPEKILDAIQSFFANQQKLSGKTVLVTSGPTYEPIDPVRFIGNRSSGKMGYALAIDLATRGAEVIFITGTTRQLPSHPNISVHKVTSASEMFEVTTQNFPNCQAAILAAAVSDFAPKHFTNEKIKRKGNQLTLVLEPTKDIAKELGSKKTKDQVLIGFALETHNEVANAKQKIESKNLDFIVLNSTNDDGAGFEVDTNKISIIHRSGEIIAFDLKSKQDVAKDIVDELVKTMGIA